MAQGGIPQDNTKFVNLSQAVTSVNCLKDESSKLKVMELLDEINAIEFSPDNLLDKQKISSLLLHLSNTIPDCELNLVQKFCTLVYQLFSQSKICLPELLPTLSAYFVRVASSSPIDMPSLLEAIGALLSSEVSAFSSYEDLLLGENGVLIEQAISRNPNAVCNAFRCINLLTSRKQINLSDKQIIYIVDIAVEKMHLTAAMDSLLQLDICYHALQIVHNLISVKKMLPGSDRNLDKIFTVLKTCIFFGVRVIPEVTLSRTEIPQVPKSHATGKSTVKKKSRYIKPESASNKQSALEISSSETSATSGSETEEGCATVSQAHVRHSALLCLQAVFKSVDKRTIFSYWRNFLPDNVSFGKPTGQATLITCILTDPSAKCRAAGMAALSVLLEDSKQFLSVAEERSSVQTAFTPLSVSLGLMIREVHRCLFLALSSENLCLTLLPTLRTFSFFVSNVPYNRLKSGLATKLVKHIQSFFGHKDVRMRVAALSIMVSLFQSDVSTLELTQIYSNANVTLSSTDSGSSLAIIRSPRKISSGSGCDGASPSGSCADMELSWLLKFCISCVGSQPLPVKVQAFALVSCIAKRDYELVRNHLSFIMSAALASLKDNDSTLQLHAFKLLEDLGSAFQDKMTCDEAKELAALWCDLLHSAMPCLMHCSWDYTVRIAACDAFASMVPLVYSYLPSAQQVLCVTLVLGLTKDSTSLVCISAVRCLGVYVLIDELRKDATFLSDVTGLVLEFMKVEAIHSRSRAAWTMVNLSQALVAESRDGDGMDVIPRKMLISLLETAIACCRDHDKVKVYAVKATGYLLSSLSKDSLGVQRIGELVQEAILSLSFVACSGVMRIRWNACYAIAEVFTNNSLFVDNPPWLGKLLSTLCSVVRSSKNYKVRISAAFAFSRGTSRVSFGDDTSFSNICKSLVDALQTATFTQHFLEFYYMDKLTGQIWFALVHLSRFVGACNIDDLSLLLDTPDIRQSFAGYRKLLEKMPAAEAQTHRNELSKAASHFLHLRTLLSLPQHIHLINSMHLMFMDALEGTAEPSEEPAEANEVTEVEGFPLLDSDRED